MWDGFNKRKFPRINLNCEIEILSDAHPEPIRTRTENIGLGGVCVILGRALDRFSQCRVTLDLHGKKMVSEGKVVWIVPTRDMKHAAECFDTGIEFLELEPAQAATLRAVIEKESQKTADPSKL